MINNATNGEAVINITNKQLVGKQGDDVVITLPPQRLSTDEALVFAAWIVALADHSDEHMDFLRVLEAVEQT